jgi:hypothetical protein
MQNRGGGAEGERDRDRGGRRGFGGFGEREPREAVPQLAEGGEE